MPLERQHLVRHFRWPVLLAAALFAVVIVYLSDRIVREVRAFDNSQYETAQWSLSQTEIELLALIASLRDTPFDVDQAILRFDVFYSRVKTLNESRIFAPLREDPQFSSRLTELNRFIETTVNYFDAPETMLLPNLGTIDRLAEDVRAETRQLAGMGLSLFVDTKERQRAAITERTEQLAAVIAALLFGLLLALLILYRVSKRAIRRRNALQASAARINAIVETALDGIIVADHSYKVVDFSPAAEVLFGVSAEDAIGQEFFRFLSDDRVPGTATAKDQFIEELLAATGHVTRRVTRPDGATFPAEIAFEQSQIPGTTLYIVAVRDISERIAAEKEITAARDAALRNERLKSDFLATMSHEIRTPLNGLMGNMELLQDTTLSAPQSRFIKNMESSGRILLRHIKDTLDITQYDAGKMTITPRPTHLPTLFDEIVGTLEGVAAANGTGVTWGWTSAPEPWVSVDPDRLGHILMNIVGNAIKFTHDGTVEMAATCKVVADECLLVIAVTDTGPGISPDILPRVFDDFVTGDASFDRNTSGTGLGLSIAKRFAEGLGGYLGVAETSGNGTTFVLKIPVTPISAPLPTAELLYEAALPSLSILIVEDNEINRLVVREMLEKDGHRIAEAPNGRAGVELANTTQFDVILMDISMPVLDGCAAALQIKNGDGKSSNSPIVALTANARQAEQTRFRECGMVATITKPLTRLALRSVFQDLVAPIPLPNASLLDTDHLAETQGTLGPDAFAGVSERIKAEVETFLTWFTLTPPVDHTALAERAHKLAGSAALVGANRMIALLCTLEEIARDGGDPIALTKIRPLLVATWEDTLAALQSATKTTEPTAQEY